MTAERTTTIQEPLSVESVGMACSIGLNAPSSCAAIRARISRFEELPFHDEDGQPIIGAPAPEVVPNRQGYRRLAPMLCRSILECISSRKRDLIEHRESVPLLIAIDDLRRPDYPLDLPTQLMADVQENLGMHFHHLSQVFVEGRTGFFRLLERARALLGRPEFDNCIVASVDSLVNGRALHWLEKSEHLKTDSNSDGVIPGEASAALWLTKTPNKFASMLDIMGLGFGEETSVLEEDTPNLAVGLADALRRALADAHIPLQEIDFRVGGMTGERQGFMEASTALARIQRVHKDQFELWAPAEMLGDVGAALPACMMVITAVGIAKGYAPGRSAILFVSAYSSQRGACVVVAPGGSHYGK